MYNCKFFSYEGPTTLDLDPVINNNASFLQIYAVYMLISSTDELTQRKWKDKTFSKT